MEINHQNSNPLSIKPMLYDYVGKSNLKHLIIYMVFVYGLQVVVILESFTVINLISALIPFILVLALWRFYACNKKQEFKASSIDLLIMISKVLSVFAIITSVLMGLSLIALLSFGLNLTVLLIFITTMTLIAGIFGYFASSESLGQLKEMYTKEVIRVDRFEAARVRWLIYGGLNVVVFIFTYLILKDLEGGLTQVGKKVVDFGDFSIPLNLLSQLLATILPFLWSYAFNKAQERFIQIKDEFVSDSEVF